MVILFNLCLLNALVSSRIVAINSYNKNANLGVWIQLNMGFSKVSSSQHQTIFFNLV